MGVANLTVSTGFPLVFQALGRNTYLLFVGLTLFFGWFTFTRVPETKGKTIARHEGVREVLAALRALAACGSASSLSSRLGRGENPRCVRWRLVPGGLSTRDERVTGLDLRMCTCCGLVLRYFSPGLPCF